MTTLTITTRSRNLGIVTALDNPQMDAPVVTGSLRSVENYLTEQRKAGGAYVQARLFVNGQMALAADGQPLTHESIRSLRSLIEAGSGEIAVNVNA
jgi:hypothetical protein